MAVQKANNAQRDFSGGEADAWIKRGDDLPEHKSVARQMSNWRPLSSRALANRPGRRILGVENSRVDEVIMSPGQSFFLVFGGSYVRVYNAAFAKVFDSGLVFPWTAQTAISIVWDIYRFSVYITFEGMQPRVLTWDGVSQVSTWSIALYAEDVSTSQKRTIFYRLSPRGVNMLPNFNPDGNGVLTFDQPVCVPGMVGTRMRYITSQILITAYFNPFQLQGLAFGPIFTSTILTFPAPLLATTFYRVGDEVIGQTTGAKGIITQVVDSGPSGSYIWVQRFTATNFATAEIIAGPSGSATNYLSDIQIPQPVTVWDEEVMNLFRGWPRSCFVDQSRLGFCDFPALPQLVAWSAVGVFNDLYTDENNVAPTNAIQELVPGKSRAYYVVPGAEGSEFVFCDNAIYYVPINQATPLKPGSVAFNTLLSEGVGQVQPRPVQQSIVFVSAGGTQIKAVQAVGAYSRPYIVDDISEIHSHLLHNPIAIAAPGGSDQFEESYFYVCNSDGSLLLCNFNIKSGVIDTKTTGWLPWSGAGSATWISALKGHSGVIVAALYPRGLIANVNVVERIDATQYLDAAMLYNAVPTSLTPPGGKGPLFWLASGSVDLMDGLRMMGTYQIDANGFLIPQNNAGENFASATLTAGQAWTATLEPFVPSVQPGQDVQQRLRKRRIARFMTHVQNSTGFTMCRIAGAPQKRTDPPAGTVMSRRRFEAWNQDDDPTLAPPLREQAYSIRPIGRFHDPRVAIIKDTPGPLTILELDAQVTV